MVAIVDYDAGNIRSVENALERLGCEFALSSDPDFLISADKIILPGVGNAAEAMESLRSKGLDSVLRQIRRPVLGICVGMQLMCRDSEEGPCDCIGIFDSHVRRFVPSQGCKVPHMGWNTIHNLEKKLFSGSQEASMCISYTPTILLCVRIPLPPAGTRASYSAQPSNFPLGL